MFSVSYFRAKYISLITVVCFAMTTTTWALPSSAHLSQSVAPAIKSVEIPEELASIEQTFQSQAPDRPLVIHIQNAHANIESQFQIRSILRYMFQRVGLRLALVEGAVNQLDPSLLQFFPDQDLNVKINEQLATQGMVSGVQLFLLESGNEMKVFGIEDAKLYRENLANFRDVMRDESTIQKFLSHGTAILTNLEQKLFARELGEFMTKRKAFNEHRLDLVAYADELRILARKHLNLDLGRADSQYEWPSLVRLIMLKNVEEIDKSMFEAEYKHLEAKLAESGVPDSLREKLSELKAHTVEKNEIRFDSAKPRFLVEQIYMKSSEHFSVAEYPQVAGWLIREILGSELDGAELMNEIEKLGGLLLERLTARPIEKELLTLIEDFDLLASALNLELTGEQFDTLTARKSEVEFDLLQKRFASLQEEAGVPASAIKPFQVSSEKMNALLEAANRFYYHARLRDDAMVRKTAEIVNREHAGVVALITGGFHTQGILKELRKGDISYVAITPRLRGALNLDRTNYISNLMNTKPNIFAQAHLDAIQVAQLQSPSNPFEVFRQMDPDDEENGVPKTVEELATGLITAFAALKVPVTRLPDFRSNSLLPLEISLSTDHRSVLVKAWGTEVKYSAGAGGVLDEFSLKGAVATLGKEAREAEVARKIEASRTPAVVEQAEKIVTGRSVEDQFLTALKQLSRPESLTRIDKTLLQELSQALVDANIALTATERSTAISKIPDILANISSGASGTLALRGLAMQLTEIPPPRIWATLIESDFPEALSGFLGLPQWSNIELTAEPKQITASEISGPTARRRSTERPTGAQPSGVNLVTGFGAQRNIKESAKLILGRLKAGASGDVPRSQIAEKLNRIDWKGPQREMLEMLAEELSVQVDGSVSKNTFERIAAVLDQLSWGQIPDAENASLLVSELLSALNLKAPQSFRYQEGSRIILENRVAQKEIVAIQITGTGDAGEPGQVVSPEIVGNLKSGAPIISALVRPGEKIKVGSTVSREGLAAGGFARGIGPIVASENVSLIISRGTGSGLILTIENEYPASVLSVKAPAGFGIQNKITQEPIELEAPKSVAIPQALPQLPDVTQLSLAELQAEVFREFAGRFSDASLLPEKLPEMKLAVAKKVARGIVEPNRFLMELNRRSKIEFNTGSTGVPVETTEESVSAAEPTYTQGMGNDYREVLGRSGGIAAIFDATRGEAPTETNVKAYLAQLKEAAASNLKVAIIVRVSDITQKTHEALIRRVAQDLGLDPKQYKIMTATNETEFAKKIANVPNMLASYVTDAERKAHVTFIVPEKLREEVSDYIKDVRVITHEIDPAMPGAEVLHYWLGAGAVLYSLLSKELDDARVRAILEPFKPDAERPGFFSFVTKLALDLKTDFAIMQRVLTSV